MRTVLQVKLYKRRLELEHTREDMSEITGLPYWSIRDWEEGRRRPVRKSWTVIADYLGCSAEEVGRWANEREVPRETWRGVGKKTRRLARRLR